LVFNFASRAQEVNLASIALEGIEFSLKAAGIPDTLHTLNVIIHNEKFSKEFDFLVQNGGIDTSIRMERSGNFIVGFPQIQTESKNIRIIPGILSIVPPLLAIFLALLLRQVIVSLLLGIYAGAIFIYDYNPVSGLIRVVDTYIINSLFDISHIQIIVFTFLFGGVVGLISKSGGTKGIANVVTRFAKTRRSGLISTWISGLIIFFDDYANSLIVGNLMRPITDKLKISREKLAFIVDATAAPVASVFIVSSWIGYEIGLIQQGLNSIGSAENAYDVFIQTIPYRFYPIAMLLFVFFNSYLQRDFGSMYRAEMRALKEGKVSRTGSQIQKDLTEASEIFGNADRAKWYNGLVPILVLIFGTIAGLIYTGDASLREEGITDYGLREIIGSSDSYLALLWASFAACLTAGAMILSQKIMDLSETVDAWFIGVRSMLLALLILTLAWSIGTITNDLKTADYIVNLISDSINPRYLPVLVFLVCAVISFATGTSWGTMAIMMPIVIPLASSVSGMYNYSPADSTLILHGVISSVLTGSVFGDHCSPIADTTILSSMASGCDHMDHVRTQLPYALLVGILCMALGDIPTAYGFSPYFSLIIISACLIAALFFIGKKVSINNFGTA
jgi:Na+/H+ antiporter NhaC